MIATSRKLGRRPLRLALNQAAYVRAMLSGEQWKCDGMMYRNDFYCVFSPCIYAYGFIGLNLVELGELLVTLLLLQNQALWTLIEQAMKLNTNGCRDKTVTVPAWRGSG